MYNFIDLSPYNNVSGYVDNLRINKKEEEKSCVDYQRLQHM